MVATPSDGKKGGYYTLSAESLSINGFEPRNLSACAHQMWLSLRKTGKIPHQVSRLSSLHKTPPYQQ
jgi:hypothetical protein